MKRKANTVAKDLRTPKYKMRVVQSEKLYKRHSKHRKRKDSDDKEN